MTLTDDYTDQPHGGNWRWIFRQDGRDVSPLDRCAKLDIDKNGAEGEQTPTTPDQQRATLIGGAHRG